MGDHSHRYQRNLFFLLIGIGFTIITGCSKTAEDFVRLDRKLAAINLPSVSYSVTPDVIDTSNATGATLSGTCSTVGGTVKLMGGLSATVPCLGGTWTTTIDATLVPDGLLVVNATQTTDAGTTGPTTTTTIPKDTAIAEAQFAKSSDRVAEASVARTINVSLSSAKLYDTVLTYSVSGSAVTTTDHTLSSGTVTIPAGQTSATIPYNIVNNGLVQIERRMIVSLSKSNRSTVVLGKISNYTLDIADSSSGTYRTILSYAVGGSDNTCVVYNSNKLFCWGNNTYYQIGDGTNIARTTPVAIDASTNYAQVVHGGGPSACGLVTDGTLKCWGYNGGGQLGDGSTSQRSAPVLSNGGQTFLKVSGGYGPHYCGITTANKLRCWGYNPYGQLGNGTTSTSASGVVIDSSVDYAQVAIGANNTCAITSLGVLKCWGDNSYGQLGDGTLTQRTSPVVVDAGVNYKSITIGHSTTCGVTTAGVLKCWGANGSGQMGNGTLVSSSTPVVIDGTVTYNWVVGGKSTNDRMCAATSTGALKCWGSSYALGDGGGVNRKTPVVIDDGTSYTSLLLGGVDACGMTTDGTLKCWGLNTSGQAQPYSNIYETTPIAVASAVSMTSFTRGAEHICGILTGGKLSCWGLNSNGQLGDGTAYLRTVPVSAENANTYSKVSAGNAHTCGLTPTGVLRCWGANTSGQLGDGSVVSKTSSVVVDSGTAYKEISAGYSSTCGITTTGILKCWGTNTSGLGDGSTNHLSPAVIDSGTLYKGISLGAYNTCGVTVAGALKCWGKNNLGQVGDTTTTTRPTPVAVDAGTTYASVSVGLSTYVPTPCAITSAGVLKCWGYNFYSQVGDGTTTDRTAPVVVDSGVSYQLVTVGDDTSCGVTIASGLKCWGEGTSAEIGDGAFLNRSTPVSVDASTTYASVQSQGSGTCGLTTSNALKCWGAVTNYGNFARGDELFTPSAMKRILEP